MFNRKIFFVICRVIFVLVCSFVYRVFFEVFVFFFFLEINIFELEFDLYRGLYKVRYKLC